MNMDIFNSIKNFVYSILFPSTCVGCNKLSSNQLCYECKKTLENELSPKITNVPNTTSKCISCFVYKEKVRDIIHNFKFKNQINTSIILSHFLTIAIRKELKLYKFDIITYVPAYKTSHSRLYNTSKILAYELSKNLGIPVKDCLIKNIDNKKQHKLSLLERQKNVKGVYSCIEHLENKNIILCDDIITTGATLSECVKELHKFGANVVCVTVARTPLN